MGRYENGKYKKFCENFEKYVFGEEIDLKLIATPYTLKAWLRFDKKEENDKMMEILKNLMSVGSEENVVTSRSSDENEESGSSVF